MENLYEMIPLSIEPSKTMYIRIEAETKAARAFRRAVFYLQFRHALCGYQKASSILIRQVRRAGSSGTGARMGLQQGQEPFSFFEMLTAGRGGHSRRLNRAAYSSCGTGVPKK